MLNAFQKKVAGWAVTCVSLAAIAVFSVASLKILSVFLDKFAAVVWPLAVAAIAAIVLKPAVDMISSKLRIPLWAATAILYAATVVATCAIAIFAIPVLAKQLVLLAASIPDGIANAKIFLSEHFPNIKDWVQTHFDAFQTEAVAAVNPETFAKYFGRFAKTAWTATGNATRFFAFVAAFAAAPIYLYYMLSARFDLFGFIDRNIKYCNDNLRESIVFFARRFAEILTAFFRGQLAIAMIMGILYGAGFAVAGVKFGLLIGLFAGLLNMIPYLGTMVGLALVLPVSAFQDDGGLGLVAAALAVFVFVQMTEGYILTPKIMGGKTGLHPTVIIFSVFFWGVALDGIIGMVLAIPLTAFVVALYRGGKIAGKMRNDTSSTKKIGAN